MLLFQVDVRQFLLLAIFVTLELCSSGCSFGGGRANQPKYNSNAGADALRHYDKNNDGSISGDELNLASELKASLAQIDLDNDKRLTAQEIDARVKEWQKSKVAEMPVRCKVTLNDSPLKDAEVKFIPVDFLGTELSPAGGTTSESGVAVISMPKEKLSDSRYPGVACGWYKISVTSSIKKIPSLYNSETNLGCEVAMNADWVTVGEIALKLVTH